MGATDTKPSESEEVLLEGDKQHANEPDTEKSSAHVTPTTTEEKAIEAHKPIKGPSNHPTLAEHFDLPEDYADLVRGYLQDTSPMSKKKVEISSDEIDEILENISEILSAPLGSQVFFGGLESVISLVNKAKEHAASRSAVGEASDRDESE